MAKVNAEVYELRWGYLGEDDNFTISSESAGHGAESSGQVRGDGSDSPGRHWGREQGKLHRVFSGSRLFFTHR